MTTSNGAAETTGAQSVDRAVTVLELLAKLGEATVSDVASAVGVHRSTISRLLAVLEGRGMVEVAGARGRYRLGRGILRLASAVQDNLDVAAQSSDICAELAKILDETVNIAVPSGGSAINVSQAEGSGTITVNNWVGRPTPLHATSSGKILLAWMTEAERDDILSRPLPAYTPDTVTDPAALRRELAAARAAGFATTVGELEAGLNAIAAPIRTAGGSVIAALSASGPSYRLSPELMVQQAGEVIVAAARISARIGFLS